MKVITIKQPYASLIRAGYKKYEFRTWKTKYRGPILIHAGLGVDKDAIERFKEYNLTYPQGCIIARANIVDCIEVNDEMRSKLKKENENVYQNIQDKTWQGYAFKLEDVKEVKTIYVKGKLSIWEYEVKDEII